MAFETDIDHHSQQIESIRLYESLFRKYAPVFKIRDGYGFSIAEDNVNHKLKATLEAKTSNSTRPSYMVFQEEITDTNRIFHYLPMVDLIVNGRSLFINRISINLDNLLEIPNEFYVILPGQDKGTRFTCDDKRYRTTVSITAKEDTVRSQFVSGVNLRELVWPIEELQLVYKDPVTGIIGIEINFSLVGVDVSNLKDGEYTENGMLFSLKTEIVNHLPLDLGLGLA